jgi:alanine racemase
VLLARPAWITVDLGAIQHNLRAIKARLRPSTKVLAVIKAHAYGHGAVQVAKAVIDAGADLLGVTGLDEAIELRNSGITAGILMLGYTPPWQASTVVANSIAVSVFDPDLLEPLERAARLLERPAIIHLKVDTGMGRLGPSIDHFAELCQRTRLSPHIVVDGIFTHLATADAEDDRFTH